jgi:hypothetical protein
MEPDGSLPHSQGPYPEPDQSIPCLLISLLKIKFNIIFQSTHRSSKRSLSFRSPHLNPACTSPDSRTCHMPRPAHYSWFDHLNNICRSQWSCVLRHGSAAARLLDCGFESRRGHGCLSLVSVVCCQVDVSATSWSLVQRSPTECGVSQMWSWSLEKWGGLGPQGAVEPLTKKGYLVRSTDYKPLRYVDSSTPLLPRPSQSQIYYSGSYPRKSSAYAPPSMCETKLHTHTKKSNGPLSLESY